MNTAFDGVHQAHCTVISYFLELIDALEVHQTYIIIFESHQNTGRIRKRVVCLLHNHIFYLAHQIILFRLSRIGRYNATDNDVRMKILTHHVGWKIIIDSTVVSQHAVYLDRLEHKGKTHRSPYGVTQITTLQNQLLLVIHIRCDTTKWYKKFIKVTVTCSRSARIQIDKDKVHLDRINNTGRQKLRLQAQRVLKGKTYIEKLRRGKILLKIVHVFFFHLTGIPSLEIF